jgi:G:T-mismatch repair DNA endonuclease (very short patch repair protein)
MACMSRACRDVPTTCLPSRKAVVFVHGCFWHRCPHCAAGRKVVRTNIDYWHPKLARNVARDLHVRQELTDQGWKVLTIWECQAWNAGALGKLAKNLLAARPRIKRSRAFPKGHGLSRGLNTLQALANDAIPPVEIVEMPVGGPHHHKLTAGVHRLYCSLAAGFTHVPTIEGFDITARYI